MSIWNRIGDVASTIVKDAGKFGVDVAKAAVAPARMAWDIGTAPWNNADEYNGFIQPFKTAAEKAGKDIIKPLADAGGAIMKVPGVQPALERINYINQNYIREPATAIALVQGDINAGRVDFFDPESWRKTFSKAWDGKEDISFGQAVVGQYRSYYDPKFNIYDPRQREQAFKNSNWGKGLSGSVDTLAQIFGDVTIVGGKATKALKASKLASGVLKNADVVAKAAEDITKAQYGVDNRFTKVLDDFTKNDSIYALNHPIVKSSDQPALLAHLLGQSTDKDTTALVLRSALGDPHAMDELALARADMKDALETARGALSATDEYKLFAAPDGTGMIPFLNEDPAVIKAAQDNYAALVKNDEAFAKMMSLGEGGGSLTRTTGKLTQGVEDFVAQARSMRFYDKKIGTPNIEVFQPTPFHRLYQKISWAENERPAGVVDFNDPDSYKEVVATLERLRPTNAFKGTPSSLKRMGVITDEDANALLDDYMKAATPEQRQVAALNIEATGLRALAARHGVSAEQADEIYNTYKGARKSGLQSIKDKGFMVDLNDEILKVPQFESQSADYLPMMDFDLMNRLLKENASALRTIGARVTNPVLHYADLFQDAFKAGALLRLGYTIRNGIDSQLRIASSLGAMTSLRHLGPGFKNLINNTGRTPARMIDRYLPVHGGMSIKNVQQSTNAVIAELKALKTQIAEGEARLSLHPDDIDLTTKVNTLKELQKEKLAVYKNHTEILNSVKDRGPKTTIGTGTYKITTSDGMEYNIPDAFGGPLGEMFRRIASSQSSFQRMAESNSELLARKLQSKGFGVVRPGDAGYFEQWAQTLRQQFGNSAVVKKLAAGESVEDITRWLASSPEGRDLRKRLQIASKDSAEHVANIKGFFDKYLPETSGLRDKLRDVTANDLRAAFTDPTELPIIHGHILQEALTNTGVLNAKKVINSAFHFLGTLPEDAWARHPVYVQLYRQEAERRIQIVAALKKVEKNNPELTFRYVEPSKSLSVKKSLEANQGLNKQMASQALDAHNIIAFDKSGNYVGHISWDAKNGEIKLVHTSESARRKGVATSLYAEANRVSKTGTVKPVHSTDLSPEGAAWKNSLKNVKITPEEQEKILTAAHKTAMREMKGILFNIERRTNLATAMKYISPFFSAQENAYKTWLKLAAANPAIVNRGYNVWQAPNRSSLVTDQDGNIVPEGQTSGNDVIWLNIPKGMQGIPGLGALTKLGVPKQSLDIVFQGGMDALYNKGNPNVFSDIFPVGPYVAVPIGEIVKKKPSLEDALKWAIPYGAPKNALSGFLPAWVNKAQIAQAQLDDAQFAKTYDLIFATQQTRAKRNGSAPIPADKIMKMTQDFWKMRIAANLIMPFAPRFDSPYAYYINKSREYKRRFGMDADAKFFDDFPEFFAFTASTSNNPAKVDYTQAAVKNIEKYPELITVLKGIEPKLIGTIVNEKDGYKFSQAAYQYLYNKKISPNSKETFLSGKDPLDAQKANEAEKGWIIYSKFRDAIDEELQARVKDGRMQTASILAKGAEDLAAIKSAVIDKLSIATDANGKPIFDKKTGEYAPSAWYIDYKDSDGAKTNKVVYGLSAILNDKKFMEDHKNSATWKSVGVYFDFRKAIAEELMKRPAKSIDAKSNADLQAIYNQVVKKLTTDDPLGFKPLYDRFLTQDLVSDKYLTPKAVNK